MKIKNKMVLLFHCSIAPLFCCSVAHRLLFAVYCLLLLSVNFPVSGQSPLVHTNISEDNSLSILSWNIYMLPRKVYKSGQIKRAYAIVDQLKDKPYDIIVFQEAFDKKAKSILWNGLKENFPYQFGPGKGGLIKVSSGVWIISKLPLKNGQIIKFKSCKVQDCLAKKGAVFVEVYKNNQKFHIIGTHLQAEAGEKFQQVRKKQYRDISEKLITPLAEKNVPLFVVGDMNTAKSDTSSYNDMLKILNIEDGVLNGGDGGSYNVIDNDLKEKKSPARQARETQSIKIIDYILFQPNGIQPRSFKREVKIFQHAWDEKHKDLSDHYAVYAKIVF